MKCKISERGASIVEYALLVALVLVVAIVAINVLGQTTSGQFSSASEELVGEDG
jgi:Flp pilus assembly pilin Flp